ncbi:hypothetical protein F4604DRAFT_231375 [Suillus subluteus]|nr:hypothetical protein F4604DRAFT_231375 [Suillus subluteus]
MPPRFFDDIPGDIHSSTSRGIHHPSSHRILAHLRALLARIPLLFHHPRSHTNQATDLQQKQRQGIFSRRSPRTVEVAAVQDKKYLFVAPQPKDTHQQSSQSHSQGSSSQSQPAATSTSTTPPAPNSSTQATTPDVPTLQSRFLTLLVVHLSQVQWSLMLQRTQTISSLLYLYFFRCVLS